jgi:nucleotide-binding universal stress UspA family protein
LYENILVPLDGSPENEEALKHAIPLAEKFGGTIVLLKAVPHPVVPPPQFSIVEAESWLLYQSREKSEAEEYLAGLAGRPELASVKHRRVIGEGPTPLVILNAIEALQIDLVIMTKRRRSPILRWILGSNPKRVLRQSTAPVLVVPANQKSG